MSWLGAEFGFRFIAGRIAAVLRSDKFLGEEIGTKLVNLRVEQLWSARGGFCCDYEKNHPDPTFGGCMPF